MGEKEIRFAGNRMIVLLGEEAGAGLTIIDETAPPGMSPPPQAHLLASETFYVLEGLYEFYIDGLQEHASPGRLLSVRAGTTHWWTAGPEGGRSLIVFVPGGMEGYFAELGEALASAGDEPLSESFHSRMRDRYGMEIRE